MTLKTSHWLKALVAAAITGCSTTFLSALGITGADAVGMKVTQLDPKQMAILVLFGGLVGAAAYLKQSPMPPDEP